MEFKVSYRKILKALQKVQSIIERREIKPILSNVLIKAEEIKIEINATNLEVSIKEDLTANVIKTGSVVVDAKKTYEIIKEMPDEDILFKKKENNWVEISTGNILFNIPGLDPKEFPEISFVDYENFQEINKKTLKEMIEKTFYAASNDETRPNLNGVFLEKTTINERGFLRMVATDGHRLAMIDKSTDEINNQSSFNFEPLGKGIIFPKRGLVELKKIVDEESDSQTIFFLCKKNSGSFKKDNIVLAIRIIDEEFPSYKQAIPEEIKKEIKIDRLKFWGALRRMSVMAEERSRAINLKFSGNQLEIFTLNPIFGEGRETIPISYGGEEIMLGFNASYLIDALNALDGDEVVLKIKDKDSPVIVNYIGGERHTCVIMPMEIKE